MLAAGGRFGAGSFCGSPSGCCPVVVGARSRGLAWRLGLGTGARAVIRRSGESRRDDRAVESLSSAAPPGLEPDRYRPRHPGLKAWASLGRASGASGVPASGGDGGVSSSVADGGGMPPARPGTVAMEPLAPLQGAVFHNSHAAFRRSPLRCDLRLLSGIPPGCPA